MRNPTPEDRASETEDLADDTAEAHESDEAADSRRVARERTIGNIR